MAILVTETFEVARVEVGDDYQVHLWQAQKALSYKPEQARKLAQELLDAAEEAEESIGEHLKGLAARMAADSGVGPL